MSPSDDTVGQEGDAHPERMNEREISGTYEDIEEPDRDIDAVTQSLVAVKAGDRVKIGIGVDLGAGLTGGTIRGNVLSVELDIEGFDRRVSILNEIDDDGWGRLYITGLGHDKFDDWEIVSAPYHVLTGTANVSDMASHGWVVAAEEVSPCD